MSAATTTTHAKPTVLIAAGGTGGHVFPGVAVAEALRRAADVRIVFFGTPRGIESRVLTEQGYELELLDVAPLKGVGPARAALSALVAGRETARALRRVAALKPRVVLSVGGYAAGPVCLAAALMGAPVAVLEPNSIAGLTNRLIAPLAKEAYVAWPSAGAQLRGPNVRVLGVPLRTLFRPSEISSHGGARVLVMGGSLGAAALNERLPTALGAIAAEFPNLEVLHQTGRDRDEAVRAAYAREKVPHVTVTPFLDDVARELERADVVVARAGAVTVAEIAAVGRAAILIPYPHAADDHQAKNAAALADVGGALSIRQEAADAVRLAREIGGLLRDEATRRAMAAAARAHGKPHAARDVARALLALGRIAPRPETNGAGKSTNGVAGARSREVH